MSNIRIGTSGWSYKEWEVVFYRKGEKQKLAYYSKYFNTVEIDSSFYAYPKLAMVQGYARATPDDFVFSAKIPKLITHDKKLDVEKGVGRDLMMFLHDMRPLMDRKKLGPLLIQLPPSFSYEAGLGKLISFFEVLPTDLRFAVEFRNKSWLRPETYDLLRKCNVANTIVDEPLLPPDMVVTADFAFVRWHGHGSKPWYNYRYKDEELKEWVPKVKEVASKTREVYGYMNNHPSGYAVESAAKEINMLGIADQEQKALQPRVTRAIDLMAMRNANRQTRLSFGAEP